MTLSELEEALEARDLSMTLWSPNPDWSVWLFCADDPMLGIFPGTGETIEEAVKKALACWDQRREKEVEPS